MNIQIAICDRDGEVCRDIKTLILRQKPAAHIQIFHSAAELLAADTRFQIYFLDIQGISGLDLAHKIRDRQQTPGSCKSIIIFVTGYDEYMAEAFDVQAYHYLTKPLRPEKFAQVLTRAYQETEFAVQETEQFVLLKISGQRRKIPVRHIVYIESNNKRAIIHTTEGIYEVQETMSELETALGQYFYRCHRCYLVNLAHITAYSHTDIELANGEKVLLAYKKYAAFVKAYLTYAKRGGIVNV